MKTSHQTLLSFLSALFPDLYPEERIEGRFLHPTTKRIFSRFYRTLPEVLIATIAQRTSRHCFFGVALRCGGSTAAHCTRVGTLWADIDAKLWSDAKDPLQAAYNAIAAAPIPPSMVVCSGGGWQSYWLLSSPALVTVERVRLEQLNRALAALVCGPTRRPDAVQDMARILRIPGSLNHKYTPAPEVRIHDFDPLRRYALDELEQALPQQPENAPTSLPDTPSCWEAAVPRTLPALQPHIQQLLACPGSSGYRSASEADAAAATALIGAGFTAEEAYTVLLSSPRGQDAVTRKGVRHYQAYWKRTITHAAAYVGPVIIRQGIAVRLAAQKEQGI